MNREQYLVKQMWLRAAADIRQGRGAGERHGVSASPQPMPDSLADYYQRFHRCAEGELRNNSR